MMSKIVLSPSRDGRTELHIDQVTDGLNEKSNRGQELHFGSQDLIRFAGFSKSRGFKVISFMIADAYLTLLGPEEQLELSDEMLLLLNSYGSEELESAMREEFSGLYIVGVNLIAYESRMRISVRRRGYIDTRVGDEAEALIKSAWQELHLT